MKRGLFLFAILSHFETAHAQFIELCSTLFTDFSGRYAHRIEYQTRPMTDLDGRPMLLSPMPGPANINVTTSRLILTADHRKTDDYNRSLKEKKRVENPVPGGQRGLGVTEQWIFFLADHIHKLLSLVTQFHSQHFTAEQLKMLGSLVEFTKTQVPVIMVDDPKQFEVPNGQQRIARTTGVPGEPIYFNAELIKTADFGKIKDKNEEYGNVTVTPPFDNIVPTPFVISYGDRNDFKKRFFNQSDVDRLVSLVSIFVHELGHSLKVQGDIEKTLDQLGGAVARLFKDRFDSINLSHKNHPWLKFLHLSMDRGRRNGLLLLFDSMNFYDLTEHVSAEVRRRAGLDFKEYSIANMHWEAEHTVDLEKYTVPDVLNLDWVAHTADGDKVVPLRIVNYFAASDSSSGEVAPSAPWQFRPVQLSQDKFTLNIELQIMTDKVRDARQIQVPLVTQKVMNDRSSYRAGEVWKVTTEIDLPSTDLPKNTQAFFENPQMVNSGFIKRARIPFTRTRLEPIGPRKALVHAEFDVPAGIRTGDYHWSGVDLTYANRASLRYEPNEIQPIHLEGVSAIPALGWIGVAHFMFETPNKMGPRPRPLFRMDDVRHLPFGGSLPIVFEIENMSAPQRLVLNGKAQYSEPGPLNHLEGLHLEVFGPHKSPFIGEVRRSVKGGRQQLIIYINAPKAINGEKLEALFIDSVYLLDQQLNELFQPAPLGIGVHVK